MNQGKSSFAFDEVSSFSWMRGKTGCVLIHGFTGTPWGLKGLGKYLVDRNISVVAPLLAGHGTRPGDMMGVGWEEWVRKPWEEVENLRQTSDAIFLIGHSMGGAIALYLASQIKVDGVVSLSSPVALSGIRVRLVPVIRLFKKNWKKRHRPLVGRDYPEIREYDCYPLDSVMELRRFLKVAYESLPEVKTPVLILHARGDRRIPVGNADTIYDRIAAGDKKKILLDDPCHLITMGEDRERVNREVFQFIRAHAKGSR